MSDKLHIGVGMRWPEEREMFDWLMRSGKRKKLIQIIAEAGDIERVEGCGDAGKIYRVRVDWREDAEAYRALMRAQEKGQSMAAYAYTALRRAWTREWELERKVSIDRDWKILLCGVDAEGRRVDEEERLRARERLRVRADRGMRIDSELVESDIISG